MEITETDIQNAMQLSRLHNNASNLSDALFSMLFHELKFFKECKDVREGTYLLAKTCANFTSHSISLYLKSIFDDRAMYIEERKTFITHFTKSFISSLELEEKQHVFLSDAIIKRMLNND